MSPFQEIVDTYGIPHYQEANPALFYIITFPFMFGIMFGDVGHGLVVTIAALYVLMYHNDIHSKLYQLKWMIFLMGIFAVYCGLVYNEFFSMPLLFSNSCYAVRGRERKPDCVYGFGIDFIWMISVNETSFVNSFKMKFAIIIGVSQMLLGIVLKGLNSVHFKSYIDLLFEVIPQFIFMAVTFGYMSACIFIKWLQDWTNKDPVSIIQLFIDFYRVKGNPLYYDADTQQAVQRAFIVIAISCIALMLLPKPLILYFFYSKKEANKVDEEDQDQEHKLILSVG